MSLTLRKIKRRQVPYGRGAEIDQNTGQVRPGYKTAYVRKMIRRHRVLLAGYRRQRGWSYR